LLWEFLIVIINAAVCAASFIYFAYAYPYRNHTPLKIFEVILFASTLFSRPIALFFMVCFEVVQVNEVGLKLQQELALADLATYSDGSKILSSSLVFPLAYRVASYIYLTRAVVVTNLAAYIVSLLSGLAKSLSKVS